MTDRILSGKYRILEPIGTGGMANVYKATQLSAPHRTVAIKMLKKEYQNDAAFTRRFQYEAQAVLNLSHENIVRSFDVGEDDGDPYIVLEYIEGKTLKQIIKEQGPLSAKTAVHYAVQILDALSHAHAKGIVHRDVKPQNVIVTPRGKVKLTDFGIARDAYASTMTFTGTSVMGSVHYISPEQASGKNVTNASDLYSLGVALYEMLTGEVPFQSENPVSIALKHLQDTFPVPEKVSPQISSALSDVILKATQKDPALRYASAKSMRQDLQRALREPNGTFAHVAPEPSRTDAPHPKKGVWKIGLGVAVVLSVFVCIFLMGRTLLIQNDAGKGDLVPKLVGKSVDEARDTAGLRNYEVEVAGTAAAQDYAPGIIIAQNPQAGTLATPGSQIFVTVSEGTVMPTVPDLTGATLSQATQLLTEAGLRIGEVQYQTSEHPAGEVFKQDPVSGTTLVQGDDVRVFISGEPDNSIEMPSVTTLSLEKALILLHDRGLTNIRIRPEVTDTNVKELEDTVVRQTPAMGEPAQKDALIELSVYDSIQGNFFADVAFNVDITEKNTPVMVTLLCEHDMIPYETVLYENQLGKGQQQPIAFTAYSGQYGAQSLIVYVNGQEVARHDIHFTYRS